MDHVRCLGQASGTLLVAINGLSVLHFNPSQISYSSWPLFFCLILTEHTYSHYSIHLKKKSSVVQLKEPQTLIGIFI